MENVMRLTATCIALGIPLAFGGFVIASAACFVLAYLANVARRRA